MNLIILFDDDFVCERIACLHDHRLQHVLQIHQAKAGDTLRVGRLNGNIGEARVVEVSSEKLTLEINAFDKQPPAALPITLILALPRPKMLRRIVRMSGEFGIKSLHLINSYRVEKSYWQTPALSDDTIDRYLLQGLEQAKDTVLPTVHLHRRFKPFVEDELAAICNNTTRLICHPGDSEPCPHQIDQAVTLVIGPEGGFIPYEVEKFETAGFRQIHLGKRIYRVEHAIPLAIAKLFD